LDFRAGVNLRTPHEIIWHMTGVLVLNCIITFLY